MTRLTDLSLVKRIVMFAVLFFFIAEFSLTFCYADSMNSELQNGKAVKAWNVQAEPALKAGIAKYWYPQSVERVVIAVDRSRTKANIKGWTDLKNCSCNVSFKDLNPEGSYILASISYGLNGETQEFAPSKAIRLLHTINNQGRLDLESHDGPVWICFSSQAKQMMKDNASIQVIVPKEGTLSFARGILSKNKVSVSGTIDMSGTDSAIADYKVINEYSAHYVKIMRKDIRNTGLLTSFNGVEHTLYALIFIILLVVWISTLLYRSMNKNVRRTIYMIGIMILGWVVLRIIKYDLPNGAWIRYLWYSYYFFQFGLGILMVWLAYIVDKPDIARVKWPVWFKTLISIEAVLLAIIFTNDMHQWVFIFNTGLADFNNYSYNILFYIVFAVSLGTILVAMIMLIVKSGKSRRKKYVIMPVIVFILMVTYGFAYTTGAVARNLPDYTLSICFLGMLFMESTIHSGLLHLNRLYGKLFEHSSLRMMIADSKGKPLYTSKNMEDVTPEIVEQLGESDDGWIELYENEYLYADDIPGGKVIRREDLTTINNLKKKTEEAIHGLETTSLFLERREKAAHEVLSEEEKNRIMDTLAGEIEGRVGQLNSMVDELPDMDDKKQQIAKVALLLCYIKRRCNLFFLRRENKLMPGSELAVYLDELAEFAGYAGINVLTANTATGEITNIKATLIYDMFYSVLERILPLGESLLREQFVEETGEVKFQIFLGQDLTPLPFKDVLKSVESENGTVLTRELDESMYSITLSFPLGGDKL